MNQTVITRRMDRAKAHLRNIIREEAPASTLGEKAKHAMSSVTRRAGRERIRIASRMVNANA